VLLGAAAPSATQQAPKRNSSPRPDRPQDAAASCYGARGRRSRARAFISASRKVVAWCTAGSGSATSRNSASNVAVKCGSRKSSRATCRVSGQVGIGLVWCNTLPCPAGRLRAEQRAERRSLPASIVSRRPLCACDACADRTRAAGLAARHRAAPALGPHQGQGLGLTDCRAYTREAGR